MVPFDDDSDTFAWLKTTFSVLDNLQNNLLENISRHHFKIFDQTCTLLASFDRINWTRWRPVPRLSRGDGYACLSSQSPPTKGCGPKYGSEWCSVPMSDSSHWHLCITWLDPTHSIDTYGGPRLSKCSVPPNPSPTVQSCQRMQIAGSKYDDTIWCCVLALRC